MPVNRHTPNTARSPPVHHPTIACCTGPVAQRTCRAALEGLRDANTFFPAVDAVVELIYCTSHRGRPKDDIAALVQLIVPEVMALKPRCGAGGEGMAKESRVGVRVKGWCW